MSKIDFVLTWVNGSDPEWIKNVSKYSSSNICESRYRDWGLLRYWFRAVEKYAPWVNKVHFVTEGHLPDFLEVNHSKLNIVKHEDFIPKKYLPTFSSHPIELNLHRIKGLEETFVYFNDDIYLNRRVNPEDFFKEGMPRDCAIVNPVAPSYYGSISNVMINNIAILNGSFNKHRAIKENIFKWFNYKYGILNILNIIFLPWPKFPGLLQTHLHSNFLKSSFQKSWEEYYKVLDITCRNRFRNTLTDVNQWLIKQQQVLDGRFCPQSPKIGEYHMIRNYEDIEKVSRSIENGKKKVICINDHCSKEVYEEAVTILQSTFQNKLAERSSFERDI